MIDRHVQPIPPVIFSGTVEHGDHVRALLGYPTANITRADYRQADVDLQPGVYVGTAAILDRNEIFPALILLTPDAHHPAPKLEVHLLSFNENLYGQKLQIIISYHLRNYYQAVSVAELKALWAADLSYVREKLLHI